jgi:hypothetical protein
MTAKLLTRRVLIISFSYAPMLNPRAFRWTALAEGIARRGIEVDVITSWVTKSPLVEHHNGVTVYRAGWHWLESLRELIRRRRNRVPAQSTAGADGKRAIARMWLRHVVQFLNAQVWSKLYWPDSNCQWYFPARQIALRLVRSRQYDTIVSVAPSFTAVLVGQVARKASSSSRWILDLGDPFSFLTEFPPNNLRLYESLNKRVERHAFDKASGISVTNSATSGTYAKLFPESAHKLKVIPPLLTPVRNAGKQRFFPEGKVKRLVYTGTLYRNLREPGFLLNLFEASLADNSIGPIELHFFGDVSSCASIFDRYRSLIDTKLFIHGLVSRDAVARATNEATILVNIGNDTVSQLPSKVVEYAATGKPIVNIVRTSNDSSAAFFAEYPDHIDLTDTGTPTIEQCKAFANFLSGPERMIPQDVLESWLSPYTFPRVMSQYLSMIE